MVKKHYNVYYLWSNFIYLIIAKAVHNEENTIKSKAITFKLFQRIRFSYKTHSLLFATANNFGYLQLDNLPKNKAELIPLVTKQQVSIRVVRLKLCVDEVDLIVRVCRFGWKAVFNIWLGFIVLQRGRVVVFYLWDWFFFSVDYKETNSTENY